MDWEDLLLQGTRRTSSGASEYQRGVSEADELQSGRLHHDVLRQKIGDGGPTTHGLYYRLEVFEIEEKDGQHFVSAECQSLIAGIGQVHWHRYLLLEVTGADMTEKDWEHRLATVPYVAVVDSKSLYDCMNRLVCTYAQVEDKRTAIDVAILKDDLQKTGGPPKVDRRR